MSIRYFFLIFGWTTIALMAMAQPQQVRGPTPTPPKIPSEVTRPAPAPISKVPTVNQPSPAQPTTTPTNSAPIRQALPNPVVPNPVKPNPITPITETPKTGPAKRSILWSNDTVKGGLAVINPAIKRPPQDVVDSPQFQTLALQSLQKFKVGSTLSPALIRALHESSEKKKLNETIELTFQYAYQSEMLAAMWLMVTTPGENRYYYPHFTDPQERRNTTKRTNPNDKDLFYKKSKDDLAGLRLVAKRSLPGGVEVSFIAAFDYYPTSPFGIATIMSADNMRMHLLLPGKGPVMDRFAGLSWTKVKEGLDIFIVPTLASDKDGDDRFKTSYQGVIASPSCIDCHGNGRQVGKAKFDLSIPEQPGVGEYLTYAFKQEAAHYRKQLKLRSEEELPAAVQTETIEARRAAQPPRTPSPTDQSVAGRG